jgi:8-oxo-dGTP pyrophosphatase MutT (NUDIX family)
MCPGPTIAPVRHSRVSRSQTCHSPSSFVKTTRLPTLRVVTATRSNVRGVRWTVHGEQSIYSSYWIDLHLVDVELPDGTRFPHHVVRMHRDAVGVVAHDPARGILLIHRHRFVTDTWGWEIPAGAIDEGETPAEAAVRETLEETGWAPGPLREMGWSFPTNGLMDQRFRYYLAEGATQVGEPSDRAEVERVEWKQVDEVRRILGTDELRDGLSVSGLALALAKELA